MVPKDKNTKRLWQIAIFRDDIKLKLGDAICEKHFNPEDMMYKKITYAPDGVTVSGRVSRLFFLFIYSHFNISFDRIKKISYKKTLNN